jgi:hypothetical protein
MEHREEAASMALSQVESMRMRMRMMEERCN